MEVDEEIRDTCVASEIRHADSTCTYIKKDKGISLKAVTPPQLLFRIKRNYERKKEEAKVSRKLSLYFFFSECIMHCLHGETKGKNFDDDFSYFTLSRFQTGSTYAIHNATIRVSGNLMERRKES